MSGTWQISKEYSILSKIISQGDIEAMHDAPDFKKGHVIRAYKTPRPGEKADHLLTNAYLGMVTEKRPGYWDELNKMLFEGGTLIPSSTMVEDILDKLSFLFLSRDMVTECEKKAHFSKQFYVKYFTYTFIFCTKALLDSLAVFLNYMYKLGFQGGDIDFKWGRFKDAIVTKKEKLGKSIIKQDQWIQDVVKFRDNLIHKHGLYVGPVPTVPEDLTEQEQTAFILKEPFYFPKDPDLTTVKIMERKEGNFIKLSYFMEDWYNKALKLTDLVLADFTATFARRDQIPYVG